MPGYCDPDDVRKALQKSGLDSATGNSGDGPLAVDIVEQAIEAASDWFARRSRGHWYDSTADTDSDANNDYLYTDVKSASDVLLDVPSSPYRQRGQLLSDYHDAMYPVTTAGEYAKVSLPHRHVQQVTKLNVRDRGGDVDDWVAGSQTEGRGEDYYISTPGQEGTGESYLFIRAPEIGPREDYQNLLEASYDYGLDAQTARWMNVRRGVASLAAAEVVDNDSVISQIPDNARLVSAQTEHQNLLDTANKLLQPYLEAGVA